VIAQPFFEINVSDDVIIEGLPIWSDNYAWLLHHRPSGSTLVVDAPEAPPVLERLAARAWRLDAVLNTHHHPDHVGGNLGLQAATGAPIFGCGADAGRLPGLDRAVQPGDRRTLGPWGLEVLDLSAHTRAHIGWWLPALGLLFPGDALFVGGCGRLFEGSPAQLTATLGRLAALPDAARFFCAHEYTLANLRWARSLLPADLALQAAEAAAIDRRAAGLPTVPGTIGAERRHNLYFRAGEPAVAAALGLPQSSPALDVITALRAHKDQHRG
jgi:hydroxyacylglutathione hydrolase